MAKVSSYSTSLYNELDNSILEHVKVWLIQSINQSSCYAPSLLDSNIRMVVHVNIHITEDNEQL